MTDLTELKFHEKKVRVLDIDGSPWWVAADVAVVLEYRMPSDFTRWLADDEKGTHSVRTPGGRQKMLAVNQFGLFSVILRSKSKRAAEFQRWVTHEVLPSIFDTGRYQIPSTTATVPSEFTKAEVWERYLLTTKKLTEKIESALAVVKERDQLAQIARVQQEHIEAEGFKDVGTVARELSSAGLIGRGRQTLFDKLHELGWVFPGRDASAKWVAYQEKIDAGYLIMRPTRYRRGEKLVPYSKVMFTGKGILHLRKILDTQFPTPLTLKELSKGK